MLDLSQLSAFNFDLEVTDQLCPTTILFRVGGLTRQPIEIGKRSPFILQYLSSQFTESHLSPHRTCQDPIGLTPPKSNDNYNHADRLRSTVAANRLVGNLV